MKRLIFSLLIVFSSNVLAEQAAVVEEVLTTVQIARLFEEQNILDINNLPDLVDREEKVSKCVEEYIKKQLRSYSKIVQNNLYDLIHNFDRITSRIYGKKPAEDDGITHEDKIEALARLQCEAYYAIKVLK
jgi:hypothetical protein